MNSIYGKEATVKGSFFFFVQSVEIAVSSENRNKFGGRCDMEHSLKKSIALAMAGFSLVTGLTTVNCLNVEARVEIPLEPYVDEIHRDANGNLVDCAGIFRLDNGYYTTVAKGLDANDMSTVLNARFPELNISYEVRGFYRACTGNELGLPKKTFEELVNKREKLRELSIHSAMSCVPNGTAAIDIPVLVANYVGDHCTYDREAVKIPERLTEMQKLHPFYAYGRGVCTTYALAFNSIVSACPINPATGIVDWSCEKPIHIRTYAVMNNRHAWSALSFGQDWKYYDACSYDFNRDTKYLDMKIGQGVMTHPRYQNPSNLDSKV